MQSNGPFRKLSCAMLVTSFGGQLNGKKMVHEFLVFIEAEDSSEGLVKVHVATRKKVYKYLEVC